MKLIAHRGYNNLMSFQKAIDCGNFHGLEIDIQLDENNKIIINHDLLTTSTLYLETFLEQIKIPKDMKIFLDIKGFDDILPPLEDFFKNKNLDRYIFCSFNLKILKNLTLPVNKGIVTSNLLRKCDLESMVDDKTHYLLVDWTMLEDEFIRDCHSLGLRVYAFTPKTQREFMYTIQYDIQGIILNSEVTLLK